jgi:hypothetical protein
VLQQLGIVSTALKILIKMGRGVEIIPRGVYFGVNVTMKYLKVEIASPTAHKILFLQNTVYYYNIVTHTVGVYYLLTTE